MNTHSQAPISRRRWKRSIVSFGALLAATTMQAQSTPAADEPKAPAADAAQNKPKPPVETVKKTDASLDDSEILILTPFQVDARKDRGYFAANTLSGTRINSKVENLGASITVVTKQQLSDTAALDINDIFRYEANVEGTYNYTAINSGSPTTDLIQGGTATSGGPALATRVRGISAPNSALDNFIHTARIPIDTYNIQSVEISRGPNSTLFGLGNPSGTVNTNQATADVAKRSGEVQFRVDSYGGYRSHFNFNQPLLENKLVIRVAALYSNNEFKQKPSYDLTKRVYGALTYKPFEGTVITLKAEHYREIKQAPNSLTPRDGITEWRNNGSPTWNPQTQLVTINGVTGTTAYAVGSGTTAENVTLPRGLYANANTYTRPTMYIDGGQVQLWEINRLNTAANPAATTTSNVRMLSSGTQIMRGQTNGGILYNALGVSDKSIYDWTSVNAAPTNWSTDSAALYTAEIVQQIVPNLFARVGWHLEDSVEYNRNIANTPSVLMDVNQTLVDGSSNPYYLRPYIQSIEPSIFRLPEYNDNRQAQLTYELNMTDKPGALRWLGRHRMVAYYENRRITQGTFRYREAVIDPNHPWLTAGALNYTNGVALGRPTYNYYIGPSGSNGYVDGYTAPKSGVSGVYALRYLNPTTGQWVNDQATFGTTDYVSSQTRQEITSRGFVLQSELADERVIFTGGIRKDFNRTRNSNGNVINGATGYYDNTPLRTWGLWSTAEGYTRTWGVVVKPLKWFGFSYNRASSFLPQPYAVDLAANVLPNTYGHGHDVGAFVNLLDGRLVISVKAYKQDNINDRTSNSTIGTRVARIDAGGLLPSTSADTFSLYQFANVQALAVLGAGATSDQLAAYAANITRYPGTFMNAVNANIAGAAIRGTADTEASGGELEIAYNPLPNWTIKLTGAQTETKNTTIENSFTDYIAARKAYWESVTYVNAGGQTVTWWDNYAPSGQTPHQFYDTAVAAQLKIDQALLGKSNPQVKKYTARMITNYTFTDGLLKNLGVGGSAGWDDKSVIGYLGANADVDGIVRSLDVNKSVYDRARYNFDIWASYQMKSFNDKIRTKFQINVQNLTESGGLRVVGVNPDGTPYNFRIINPRRIVFTTTFAF